MIGAPMSKDADAPPVTADCDTGTPDRSIITLSPLLAEKLKILSTELKEKGQQRRKNTTDQR
jgi:hypothetical protein